MNKLFFSSFSTVIYSNKTMRTYIYKQILAKPKHPRIKNTFYEQYSAPLHHTPVY